MNRRTVRYSSFLTVVALFLLIFQNCGPAKLSGGGTAAATSSSSSGNAGLNPTPTPGVTPTPSTSPTPIPSPTPTPVNSGTILSYDGYCWDVDDAQTADNTPLSLYTCDHDSNQKFSLSFVTSTTVMVNIAFSGKCVSADITQSYNIQEASCEPISYETFNYTDNGDGTFTLQDPNSQDCITSSDYDINADMHLFLTSCDPNNQNQHFHW